MEQAIRIARYLADRYDVHVYGIGSLFDPDNTFTVRSDIDLVVKGLPKGRFLSICAEAEQLTEFHLDIIPYEDANVLIRELHVVYTIRKLLSPSRARRERCGHTQVVPIVPAAVLPMVTVEVQTASASTTVGEHLFRRLLQLPYKRIGIHSGIFI